MQATACARELGHFLDLLIITDVCDMSFAASHGPRLPRRQGTPTHHEAAPSPTSDSPDRSSTLSSRDVRGRVIVATFLVRRVGRMDRIETGNTRLWSVARARAPTATVLCVEVVVARTVSVGGRCVGSGTPLFSRSTMNETRNSAALGSPAAPPDRGKNIERARAPMDERGGAAQRSRGLPL